MCGIFGIIGANEKIVNGDACEILKHRGPDAKGTWQNAYVIYKHTRLSIIDLSEESNQPFCPNPNYILIYNGEIYNFKELRNLLRDEYLFKTQSDTEVLYYYLIKYGLSKLENLNGLFCFSFYDIKKNKVLFARDRFGKKPLYYYKGKEFLIFSSEQKAIYSAIQTEIDYNKLGEYFLYKYIAGKETLVKNVFEFEPGYSLEYDILNHSLNLNKWFVLSNIRVKNTPEFNEKIENTLINAVEYRMISDVPLGIQLSGGLDSSIITKIAKDKSNDVVKTYTIGFPNSSYDESFFARQIAEILGTKHVAISFTINDFIDLWETTTYYNDEPINHPHSIPIYKLTHIASKDVKVLISGEGADEIFLGYMHHFDTIHHDLTGFNLINYYRFNSLNSLKKMLKSDLIKYNQIDGERNNILNENGKYIYELKTHLNTLLNRIDKMSMANSVEVRTPFLDPNVANIGLCERIENISKNGNRKIPLKIIYEKYFNTGLSSRQKIGFRVPYDEWLRDSRFNSFVCENINLLRKSPIFRYNYIDAIVNRLSKQNFEADDIKESWVLTNFSLWKRIFSL